MNKIISSKTTSALFLAIVLVVGTFALTGPTFMINAQATSDREKDYDNDKSNGKDRDDKSKKDSKNVSINKLKCINTNININGENTGDINVGNKGQGYLGTYSSDGSGYGNERYYDYGYNKDKKDNGFDCIINNNNTNINLVGGGNQTEQLTCEECFTENLSAEQLNNLTIALSVTRLGNLEGLCEQLSNTTLTNPVKLLGLSALFANAGITDVDAILRVLECLEELRLIIVPPNFDPILD